MTKKEQRSIQEITANLQSLVRTQCTDGNWNYDQYMRGMANGMLLALSVIDGETPEFLEDIPVYKKDYDILRQFNESGIVIDDRTANSK